MHRRRLLLYWSGLLAALTGPRLLAQAPPLLDGIAWVRLGVRDPQPTLRFYATLFGGELYREAGSDAYGLRLGSSLLLVQPAAEARVLEQGLAVRQAAATPQQQRLQTLGIKATAQPDDSVTVLDGDGVQTRLARTPDLSTLARPPESSLLAGIGKPLFEALLIDELFINVTNMQVDSMFYARLLDQTSTVVAGSQYFRLGAHAQLRLAQAANGQAPGFYHFSVLVTNTDLEAAAEAVFRAGGIIENILPNGFSFWDPEGLRVVVHSVPQVLEAPPQA